MTEALIERVRRMLPFASREEIAERLIADGVPAELIWLAWHAARILES